MKKIFQKISLYRVFRKSILRNRAELERIFGVRIDSVSRIYTVLNIPPELIGEPYNIRKADIDTISMQYIKEFLGEISKYLDTIGLKELYNTYQIDKVSKYSYLIVIGYALVNTDRFAKRLLFRILPLVLLASATAYFIFR